jgi:hypothetical protein
MRSTYITLWALIGESARKVGAYYDEDADAYVMVLKGYKHVPTLDPTTVERWALDSTVTRTVEYLLQSDDGDGRHSANKVGAYTVPVEYLTGRDGALRGRWGSLAERACHLLNTSDAIYRGETYDDRLDDLVAITNQVDWDC